MSTTSPSVALNVDSHPDNRRATAVDRSRPCCVSFIKFFRRLLWIYMVISLTAFMASGIYSIVEGYARDNGEYTLQLPDPRKDVTIFSSEKLQFSNLTGIALQMAQMLPIPQQYMLRGALCAGDPRVAPVPIIPERLTGINLSNSYYAAQILLCAGALYIYASSRRMLYQNFRLQEVDKEEMKEILRLKGYCRRFFDWIGRNLKYLTHMLSCFFAGFILSPTILKCNTLLLLPPPQWLCWCMGAALLGPSVVVFVLYRFFGWSWGKIQYILKLANWFEEVMVIIVFPIVLFQSFSALLQYGFVLEFSSNDGYQARTIKIVSSYFLIGDIFVQASYVFFKMCYPDSLIVASRGY